jgi:uncharacterized protein YdhG (YjbR/CyaY superfamily)
MRSSATTPDSYVANLPADRRDAVSVVRDVIRAHLPNGYEETIGSGMIVYTVARARYPNTPNKQPLWYAALAAQKRYNSLYLMSAYGSKEHARRLREGFERSGKKLDMGKSCIRFLSADDLDLDVIGELVASIPADQWIAIFEASRQKPKKSSRANG